MISARTTRRWLLSLLLPGIALTIMNGCTAKHYRASADKEVYNILAHKRAAALDDESPFSIEQTSQDPLAGLPRRHQPLVPVDKAQEEVTVPVPKLPPPAIVSLAKALEIAVANSRSYQSRKESVYLAALSLTAERHRWSPRFSALISGRWRHSGTTESWTGDAAFGVSQLLATGASVSLSVSSEVLRFFTGSPRQTVSSLLSADFTQPLWRGAGQRIARENLTQAERDVVYELRSFARFHKTFAVSIISSYYQILRQRDTVRNEWNNYQSLIRSRERIENLAEAGRRPELEVDQAEQDELRAKDRWIRAVQSYYEQLDEFKVDLGLRTDVNVDIDVDELQRLRAMGLIHPGISSADAVRQALALRLDLMNTEDGAADAERKVAVARNGLGPDVDLVASADVGTWDGNKPAKFRFDTASYSVGADIDLPLDRKNERNTYRRALITYDRARRDTADLSDNVKLQVRQAWRSLQEARESYQIQENSLTLARRRVESASLLLDIGRASTRDLLEAQSSLLEAENALTRVLVDHTVARLQLWRDIGTLMVSPQYQLEEKSRDEPIASAKAN